MAAQRKGIDQGREPGTTLPKWFYGLAAIGLLYVFLLSISLMGVAFNLFGRGFAEALIKGCSNPVVALFIGILATGIIQSSSTTTSLAVGFVGGGVLPLGYAIPIIMGANVGTTITSVIVAMGFVTRKEDFRRAFGGATVHDFFNLCTVIVLFPLEVRFHLLERMALTLTAGFNSAGGAHFASPLKAVIKPVECGIKHLFTETFALSPRAAGIGILIVAVIALIAALILLVKTLNVLIVQRAELFINRYLFRNDLTAFLLGLGLTVMAQSSSITTSLMVPLVAAGVVTLRRCYPFALGANVGTTCTALLASLATVQLGTDSCPGVTLAFAHLLFNIAGILIFYPLKSIPLTLARKLADRAVERKIWALGFILTIFFGLPLLMILLVG